jgi:hypothetical protein
MPFSPMPADPEPSEAMLRIMRSTRDGYAAMAEKLREQGLEVDGFLADCDEFIAALEGRHEGAFDVPTFIRRLNAFKEEAGEFIHIQAQVKAVEMVHNLHALLPEVEKVAAEFRERGEPFDLQTAADIEAALLRIRTGLAEGRLNHDALQDMQLAASAEMAELQRRINCREAACLLYWEQWPPERWAKASPEDRKTVEGALAQWREKKEEILGTLPLEDRRRLEAMRYEDFDRPKE